MGQEPSRIPGRMLRTQLGVHACVELFRTLADAAGQARHWPHAWPEAQDPPVVVEAAGDDHGPRLHLAVWDRGDHREVDIVGERGARDLPSAMLTLWRQRDDTVESVGQVRWLAPRS